jgi:glucose-1-phosphate cytidylyltransferase
MQAVILAGGLGTRLREETEFKPKPMVEIGGRPILWHIMKNLAGFGVRDFIIATGYKSHVIRDYFLHYSSNISDFSLCLGDPNSLTYLDEHDEASWKVTVAFTGETTPTGGRVKLVEKYLTDDRFLVAYGDGLADVDIDQLVQTHSESKRLGTVTTVRPTSRFGLVETNREGLVTAFREKPTLDSWVNIGYMVFEREALDYFTETCTLELEPLAALTEMGQLGAFHHAGFWMPMDTYREYQELSSLWSQGSAPWKMWGNENERN